MNKIFTLLSTGLVSLGTQAGIVSYTDTINSTKTNWSGTLSVPKFNGPGTLQSVQFFYRAGADFTFFDENRGTAVVSITDTATATISYSAPALHQDVIVTEIANAILQGTDHHAGSGPDFFTAYMSGTGSTTGPLMTSGLGDYIGSGMYLIPVSADASLLVTGASNLTKGILTHASAEVTVQYDYLLPEPGSVALAGIALGAIAVTSRRRSGGRAPDPASDEHGRSRRLMG